MPADDTVSSITALVKRIIRSERGAFSNHVQATFVSEEPSDTTLSQVTVQGNTIRFVRKLSHVGVLSAGQQLLCIQGGGIPLTIIGIVTGDINQTS